MRLSVITGTQEQFDAAITAPDTDENLAEYYTEQLSKAPADSVDFQALPPQEDASEAFRLINIKERAILDYLRGHDTPAAVRVIATDEEVARLYKVVYNFFYADIKANRMEDDNWD